MWHKETIANLWSSAFLRNIISSSIRNNELALSVILELNSSRIVVRLGSL